MNYAFGQALEALKDGATIARQGWNGKGMFLFLNSGSIDPVGRPALEGEGIEGIREDLFDDGGEGTVTRLPNINMRTASGSTVTGWLASQTDMLAEDWTIVREDDRS